MIDIYLIRHAESMANRYHSDRIHGSANDIELSEYGPGQAEKLGKRFLDEKIKFDQVYTSIAVRANNTCKIVCNIIDYPLEKIIKSEKLVELSKGDWKGELRNEIIKIYEESPDKWNLVPPNGESYKMTSDRMHEFFNDNELSKYNNENRTIAVFTHGNSIRSFLKPLFGFDGQKLYTIVLENTSITRLNYNNGIWQFKTLNDHTHLN
ncbi:MAG: histidine phosphatase family protein [Candidatus Woesearchaeota archaeon]